VALAGISCSNTGSVLEDLAACPSLASVSLSIEGMPAGGASILPAAGLLSLVRALCGRASTASARASTATTSSGGSFHLDVSAPEGVGWSLQAMQQLLAYGAAEQLQTFHLPLCTSQPAQ
jgi:hypothetical protein